MQRVTIIVATDSVTQCLRESQKKYDAMGNVIKQIDPRGLITEYTYDPLNRLIKTVKLVDDTEVITTTQYDAYSNIIKTTDERGNSAEFTYDKNSNLLTQKNVYGQITSYTYDKLNRPLTVKDSLERKIQIIYNEAGYPGKIEYFIDESLVKTVINTFDNNGNLLNTSDGSSDKTFAYDKLGNQTEKDIKFDDQSFKTTFSYNSVSKMITENLPTTGKIEFSYDADGQLTKIILSNESYMTFKNDVWGVVTETDRMGRLTEYSYNGFGQQTMVRKPNGAIDQFGYDSAGDLTELTDSNGNITSWEYDSRGLVTKKTYADNSSYTYSYDNSGTLIERVDAKGIQTAYEYNKFGKLTKIDYPNDPDIEYTYNPVGNLQTMSDASGTTEWFYNNMGMVSKEVDPFSNELDFVYDDLGRKTQMTVNGQQSTNYTYDPMNRVKTVIVKNEDNEHTFNYSYYKDSTLVDSITLDGTEIQKNSYDELARLTEKVNKNINNTVLSDYSFTLNNADLKTKISTNETNETKDFSYNLVDELISAKKYTEENSIKTYDQSYKYSYNFDSMGNRVSADLSNTPLSYNSNNLNQYIQLFNPDGSAGLFDYDLNGNLTKAPGYDLLVYNEDNRLVTAVKDGVKVENIYDGMGRRKIKRIYTGSEDNWILDKEIQFTYDGWKLIKEVTLDTDNQPLATKSYYWNGGTLLAVYEDNQFYFPQTDGNKNISSYTDSEGNIVAKYEYSPFGQTVNAEGEMADEFRFRFSSEYYDQDLDLYAYIFRYYSPTLGRWLSREPLGEAESINLYLFIENDPINLWDYLGERSRGSRINNKNRYSQKKSATQGGTKGAFGKSKSNSAKVSASYSPKGNPSGWSLLGEILGRLSGAATRAKIIADALEECRRMKKARNDCEGCCIIRVEYLIDHLTGGMFIHYFGGFGRYYSKPCSEVGEILCKEIQYGEIKRKYSPWHIRRTSWEILERSM